MPRKSAAALAVATPTSLAAVRSRPAPPETLGAQEADIWRRMVSALPAHWFGPEHREALSRYCRHAAAAARYQRMAVALNDRLLEMETLDSEALADLDRLARMADRESRSALAHERSFRATQQAQIRAETAGTAAKRGGLVDLDWSTAK